MGVPSFHKWLVRKYPNTVVKALVQDDSGFISINPNEFEFDNLYLDMNNIIHPCFHPDDPSHPFRPTTFDQVHAAIFEHIDHIYSIVRPRKLLYMAIDGVGPRAKMNQQRARRFRSAKDNDAMEEEEDVLRKQFEMEGKQLLPKLETEVSDSNIITPGTEFMFQLSKKHERYVTSRMETCPGWKDIKVVLSDSNVPGEGEHKIMSFIRHQRSLPRYDPNTRHCIYGLDADLILLALATHEVQFSILREDLNIQQEPLCLSALKSSLSKPATQPSSFIRKPYQFLQIWTLRDYLEIDMNIPDPPEQFSFDIERVIDDFVFICSFAGNDYLPNMPTVGLHEGAVDLLMKVYKQNFKSMGGYLVDMQRVQDPKYGFIKLERVEKFILEVGKFEDRIFKKRSEIKDRMLETIDADNEDEISDLSSTSNGSALTAEDQVLKNTMELKEKLRACIRNKSDLFRNGSLVTDKVTAHALPRPYQKLMTDAKSNIIHFYPTDFVIDMRGKRFSRQGICVLPFVDEHRLLAEVNKVEKELDAHELERNKHNTERIYIKEGTSFVELPSGRSHHMIPRPLEGTSFPDKTVTESDIGATKLWHDIPIRRNTNGNWGRSTNWSRNPEEQQDYKNKNSITSPFRSCNAPGKRFIAYSSPPIPTANIKLSGPAGSGFGAGRGRGHVNPPPAVYRLM